MLKNIFSVDLEEWYAFKGFKKFSSPKDKTPQLKYAIKPLLELLNKYNVNATFFVLGDVAKKYPDIIEEIHSQGHEIASHGYSHMPLSLISKDKFKEETKKMNKLLKSITNKKPLGFRAPLFSLTQSTKWALEILEEEGYKYDSSIFPIQTSFSYNLQFGVNKVPEGPYFIDKNDLTKISTRGGLIEYPIKKVSFLKIPFIITGGFYLRLYPLWFLKKIIKTVNKKDKFIVLFLHPWETYEKTIKQRMGFFPEFVTYYNIKSTLKKIESLFKYFKFYNFESDLEERKYI